jgi:HTH-type transcriptional regulator/antitoxin HigA
MDSPITLRTEADYRAALQRVRIIFQAQPGEPEFDELDSLATLIEAYEALHYPMFP